MWLNAASQRAVGEVEGTVVSMTNAAAEFVLPAGSLSETIDFFVDQCGFRMTLITPADDPDEAVLEGYNSVLRLVPDPDVAPGRLRLPSEHSRPAVTAPNGTSLEFFVPNTGLDLGPLEPAFVISRAADAQFGSGRAGMGYRDLIPDRQGGRFIASHIHIPDGGPVPDYVHHHHIRFQMIFCYRGWADLVYEDQGPPFRMHAGDCVLQPPHIRHRVLATSAEFDVVEIGCPARHDTLRDHELVLPNTTRNPDRDFGGQRFVWHQTSEAAWTPWRHEGLEMQDFGFGSATAGVGEARVIRTDDAQTVPSFTHDDELLFWFVLTGSATLVTEGDRHPLTAADSVALPRGGSYELVDLSDDLTWLEVIVPAPVN